MIQPELRHASLSPTPPRDGGIRDEFTGDAGGRLERPAVTDYVTAVIAGQMFGITIGEVHDVFLPTGITQVPLADPEIAGILNLRGRVVTALDVRHKLNLPPRGPEEPVLAVGIEYGSESFGLLVDEIGEVLTLPDHELETNPKNLEARWNHVSKGVFRLESRLLIVMDVETILEPMENPAPTVPRASDHG